MTREALNLIQWECQQLLNRVTMLIDGGRWRELADCYTEDAMLFRPSDPENGIEGRQAILASFKARPPRTTCHLLGNSIFDVQAPDDVLARSRVWLITGEANKPGPVPADSKILVGSFTDHLVRVADRWLIARREGGIELVYSCQA